MVQPFVIPATPSHQLQLITEHKGLGDTSTKVNPDSSELLDIHPHVKEQLLECRVEWNKCLQDFPELSYFTHIQVSRDSGSSVLPNWDNLSVYAQLSRILLSPYNSKDSILGCIGASSTDNPWETIEYSTFGPQFHYHRWSSGGHGDPSVPECLIYRLEADLCLVDEIKIRPFDAYSARYVRFQMGYPKLSLMEETFAVHEDEQKMMDDNNYVWTYTSPRFEMLQNDVLQSFKLPRPVLCIGGVVKIDIIGRVKKQESDDQYSTTYARRKSK